MAMFTSTTGKSMRSIRWSDTDDNTSLRPQTESIRARREARPNTDSLRPNTGNRRIMSETFLPRINAPNTSLRDDSIPSSMLTERNLEGNLRSSIGEIRDELSKQDQKEAEWGGYYGRKVRPGSRAGTGGRKPHRLPPWEISDDVKDALATLRQIRAMSTRSIPMISNRLIHHIGLPVPRLESNNYCRRVAFPLIRDSPMLKGWIADIEEKEPGSPNNDSHGPPCLGISDLENAEGTLDELLDPAQHYTVIANGVHIDAQKFASSLHSFHTVSLTDNGLGDSGLAELSTVLQKNTVLERLCLHYNHLTDQGAGVLAGHLSHNTTLKSLRLPFNKIGDTGGESLADMIGPCKCVNVMKAAIREGQYEVVEALIQHGHPVNPFYTEEDPLLVLAASVRGSDEVLGLLLDNGADLEARDNKGRTAFLAAAQEGVVDAMDLLHMRGADVEARDKEGRSALLLAAMGGHSDCAEYMVEKINKYPLRLVLRVLTLRDFAYDALAERHIQEAMHPSPSHSEEGGGGKGGGGFANLLKKESSFGYEHANLLKKESFARGMLGRRDSSASQTSADVTGRRPSNASDEFGRRGSSTSQQSIAAEDERLHSSWEPDVKLQARRHSVETMEWTGVRRGSHASVELGRRGSYAGEISRVRTGGSGVQGNGSPGNRSPGMGSAGRYSSGINILAQIGKTESKKDLMGRRRALMAQRRPSQQESGSVMDRLRQKGTALKRNIRKASLALSDVMPGSLMREFVPEEEELYVEAFLLFRFAGTEMKTKRFKVSEGGRAPIHEEIAFPDMLAGPSPLFTVDLWVIHPHSGEEQFAGMCSISASELIIERKVSGAVGLCVHYEISGTDIEGDAAKPMDAVWQDVADDSGRRTCSVKISMRIFPEMMFEESKIGELVLTEAARCGSTKLVQYFGAMGADLNCRDGNGNTPLILAARDGRWEVVQSLLRSKVDVEAENNAGMTALAMADRQTLDDEAEDEDEDEEPKQKGSSELVTVSDLLQAYIRTKQGVPISVRAWAVAGESSNLKNPLGFLKDLYKGEYQPAKLTIGVLRARNLPQADAMGFADPFVRITLNTQTKQSKVLKRTLTPEWNEEFVFDDQTLGVWPSQELLVEVFDWNLTSAAEFLGMFKVTVKDLQRLQPKTGEEKGECWFRLREKNGLLVKRGSKLDPSSPQTPQTPQSNSTLSFSVKGSWIGSARNLLGRTPSNDLSPTNKSGSSAKLAKLERDTSGSSNVRHYSTHKPDAEVCLSFRFDAGKGRYLQIEVVEARGLPSMDGENARPNASCSLNFFQTTVSTETVKRDSSPKWNQSFRFELKGTDALLELELKELLKPAGQNRIGLTTLPLAKIQSLIECGLEEVWVELENAEGDRLKGDDGGTAALRLRFNIASLGEHLSEEQMTELVLTKAKQAQPRISEESKFLLRQLTDGADPLVKTLGLFERLRAECGGFIGVEEMLEAAKDLAMEDGEIEALKRRYFDQLAGSPGCSDPGHFCKLLGLGGLWERDQQERQGTGRSGRGSSGRLSTGKSFREKPEVIVNQGVKATVGLKVVLRKAAIEENPELEKDTGGGTGTIVWVDPEDLDGDGEVGDIVQVRWERTGIKTDYRTGYEGVYRLAVVGTGEASAPPANDETIIRRDVPAEVGQRVVLSKIAKLLDPELRKASRDLPGTIVWVETEDRDGDGDTGDVCQVVWDATGKKGMYNTGYQGDYRLALFEPASKIAPRDLAGITELELDDNLIGKFGTTQLAQALRGNHTLVRLSMRRNRAEAAGASAIGEALKENHSLTELCLGANIVGDDGLLEISHALRDRNSAPIRSLGACLRPKFAMPETDVTYDLEENGIGAVGAKYLARALIKNKTLTWLSLKNNLIGPDGAALLEQGLRRSASLLELNVERNVLGDGGMRNLCRCLKHVPAIGRKRASPANRVLRVLNVAQNNLSDASVEFVLEGLYKNYSLHTVLFHNNSLTPEAEAKILDALAENVHEAKLEAGVICLQKIFRGRKERMRLKAERENAERLARRRKLHPPSEAEVIEEEDEVEDTLLSQAGFIEEGEDGEEEGEGQGVDNAEGDGTKAVVEGEGEGEEEKEKRMEEEKEKEEREKREEEEKEKEKEEEIRLGGQSEEQNDLLLAATKAHMFNMGEALLAEQRAAEEMAKQSSERVKAALESYEFLDGRLQWLMERNDTEQEELEEAAQRVHAAEQEAIEAMRDAEQAEEAAQKCLAAMENYHEYEREESDIADAIKKMKGGQEESEAPVSPPALVKRVSLEAWIKREGEEEEDEEMAVEEEKEGGKASGEGSGEGADQSIASEGEGGTKGEVSAAMAKGQSVMDQFERLQNMLGLTDKGEKEEDGGEGTGEEEGDKRKGEEDDGKEEEGTEENEVLLAEMKEEVAEFNRRQEEAITALAQMEEEIEREVGAVTELIRSKTVPRTPPKPAVVTEAEVMTERVKEAVRALEDAMALDDEAAIDLALARVAEQEEIAAQAMERAESVTSPTSLNKGNRTLQDSSLLDSVTEEGSEGGGAAVLDFAMDQLVSHCGMVGDGMSDDGEGPDNGSVMMLPNNTVDWTSDMYAAMQSQTEPRSEEHTKGGLVGGEAPDAERTEEGGSDGVGEGEGSRGASEEERERASAVAEGAVQLSTDQSEEQERKGETVRQPDSEKRG